MIQKTAAARKRASGEILPVSFFYAVSDAISKVSNDYSEIAVEHEEHICYYNVY